MARKKLEFWSTSTFPSINANIINVIYMSNALANHFEVSLFLFTKKNVDIKVLSNSFYINNIFNIESIAKKYSIISLIFRFLFYKHNAQVIYTRSLIIAFISSRFFFKETYLELHNIPFGFFNSLLFRFNSKSKKIKMIFITHALKKKCVEKFKINDSMTIVSPDASINFLDNTFINKKIKEKIKNKIGYFGSFHPGKGLDRVLSLAKTMNDFSFVIAGGNLDSMKLSKNIKSLGRLSHKDTLTEMSKCDFLLLPNKEKVLIYGDRDIGSVTSPLKLFEYFSAYGCVIASDISVLKEIVDNKNSLIVDFDNINQVKNKIYKLAQNPEKYNSIVKYSYDTFVKKYTWESRVKNIFKI